MPQPSRRRALPTGSLGASLLSAGLDSVTPAALLAGAISVEAATRPLSVVDLMRVGIGPSSSHTVGPMRAGRAFAAALADVVVLETGQRPAAATPAGSGGEADPGPITRLSVELHGSLGATGRGHATDRAVVMGLAGYEPETVPSRVCEDLWEEVESAGRLIIDGVGPVPFIPSRDISFLPGSVLPYHVNGMTITAHATPAPLPFSSSAQLMEICRQTGLRVSDVVAANEASARPTREVEAYLDLIHSTMVACVEAGMAADGVLPGGLGVRRRAKALHRRLQAQSSGPAAAFALADPLRGMDWVDLFALAVNEENAAGHRVVTAPTNGAAGVLPAVLLYYERFIPGAGRDGVHRFLLAATAVGSLIKMNASIAGAEVGCQGEVGSASSMAAAGLAEALGGTPSQVENAAEIAMEHSLGLTCDPVGGLVQIPCIERNAVAAVKAINAARMALWGEGRHTVSLDTVIETMRQTGEDMLSKYKETSRGGLAVNVVEC